MGPSRDPAPWRKGGEEGKRGGRKERKRREREKRKEEGDSRPATSGKILCASQNSPPQAPLAKERRGRKGKERRKEGREGKERGKGERRKGEGEKREEEGRERGRRGEEKEGGKGREGKRGGRERERGERREEGGGRKRKERGRREKERKERMVDPSAKVHCSDWRRFTAEYYCPQPRARVAFVTTERPIERLHLLSNITCSPIARFLQIGPTFLAPKSVPAAGGRRGIRRLYLAVLIGGPGICPLGVFS